MYLIHEENHSNLCVAENLGQGILWLIKNKWLDADTVGFDYDNSDDYTVGDVVKDAKENPYNILGYLVKLGAKDGMAAVLEWLESFGFYFNEIEVA